jgi:hypothetical protein
MDRIYLALKPSEQVVTRCATQIFSAYISVGMVTKGHESEWIERAVREAIQIAQCADAAVTSDDEMS